MNCNVVCIARTAGSRGEEIANLVAQKAGFKYVDEEVVLHAAELGSVEVAQVHDAEKRKSMVEKLIDAFSSGAAVHAMEPGTFVYSPAVAAAAPNASEEEMRKLIREAIANIAKDGSCVIVAHAGSFALKDSADALRVFVTASKATRSGNLTDTADKDGAIRESDRARADYLSRFYSVKDEGPQHYDLCINTDRMSVDHAADLILSCLKAPAMA